VIAWWLRDGERPTEVCNVCGHTDHLPFCYCATGRDALLAEYDYVEALLSSEPSEAA
jgi:hypothetical protein